jgi:outer membrane protein assembly factor BamB
MRSDFDALMHTSHGLGTRRFSMLHHFSRWRRWATIGLGIGSVCRAVLGVAAAEDWPAWRGPRGNSTSLESGLPVAWNAELGIAWKTPLPEWGTSTPAIWGDAVFVTTQAGDDLLVLKLGRRTGTIEWTQKVGQAATPRTGPKREKQKFHQLHNLASPSPVANGELVVVHFGNGDLAAYDFEGKLHWRRNLQEDYGGYTIWWGHANSPVLFGNLVISVCMQDSLADVTEKLAASYLVAHDLHTGKERWKSTRMTGAPAEEGDAYTTPILIEIEGKTQLIVMGANQLDAYDPASGKQIWYLPGLVGGRTVTGPTPGDGLVYVTRGMRGSLLAVKLDGGEGKRPPSDIVWKVEKGTPDSPCPVVWKDLLLTVTDDGIARAFDATTGHLHWTERLKGDYKASPLAADGRVYFLNTTGVCTVISAAKRFEKLAENELPDSTLASPAVAGGQLFIRGRQAFYCLGPMPVGANR